MYVHLLIVHHLFAQNFVGLSVLDGYIACGSETNEVQLFNIQFQHEVYFDGEFWSVSVISLHMSLYLGNSKYIRVKSWRTKDFIKDILFLSE